MHRGIKYIKILLIYLKVSRAQVLFMPALLIICAYLYADYHCQIISIKSFIFVACSILLFNLSTNTISEYRDCQKGIDDIYSPGTKYRLASGIVPQKNVLNLGIISFVLASICGVIAFFLKPYSLAFPGLFGACIAFCYSEKPLRLKYKAFGEICVFIVYGVLIFSSCILSLTYTVRLQDILFSIPFGLLTTNVVLANNIRDYEFEKNKTFTLPIKFGLKFAYTLLFFMTNLTFLCIPFFIYRDILPKAGLLVFLSYPLVFLSIKKINSPQFINIFGIMQVSFSLLIILSFIIR